MTCRSSQNIEKETSGMLERHFAGHYNQGWGSASP